MPQDVTCTISGLDGIEAKLTELLPKQAREILRRAARKGGQVFQEAIEEKAPRDTGHLADSINVASKTGSADNDDSTASITIATGPASDAYYAMFQEFGTVHQKAKPFIRPAFEENAQEVLDTFISSLQNSLGK